MSLLEIENLQTEFGSIKAVKDISFSINKGEILGIVGESGSGKSVTAHSIMRLIEPPGKISTGRIIFNDNDKQLDLLTLSDKELESILGNQISMIFQDPMTSLNPVLTIGFQIAETLRVHRGLSKAQAKKQVILLLKRIGINNAEQKFNAYPHEFSGGMRQRVMIAMAIACQPKLLIADEPTTALDVTIQSQILSLLREFRRAFGMSVVIITHDLGVVAQLADRVIVMYSGRIVENAPVKMIFQNPRHPYTQALIASIPRLGMKAERLQAIEGSPPRVLVDDESFCSFYPRCSYRMLICKESRPVLKKISGEQSAACFMTQ